MPGRVGSVGIGRAGIHGGSDWAMQQEVRLPFYITQWGRAPYRESLKTWHVPRVLNARETNLSFGSAAASAGRRKRR